MTVNLAWPRAEVYDPEGGHWYFQWFTVLVVGATVATGAAYRWYRRRRGAGQEESKEDSRLRA